MQTIEKGPSRETGAPGRRILVLAYWRSEDRALRALLGQMKELVPCAFELINLESPTAVHFRMSSRALFNRIRLYDAVVLAFTANDATAVLQPPEQRLPFGRHFLRRIPAGYLVDGSSAPGLEAAIEAHARAWRLLPLGIATTDSDLTPLASALRKAIS